MSLISKSRFRNGRREFLVEWVGYDRSQDTWEPAHHLMPETIAAFDDEKSKVRLEKADKKKKAMEDKERKLKELRDKERARRAKEEEHDEDDSSSIPKTIETKVVLSKHIRNLCGGKRQARVKDAMRMVLEYIKDEELNDQVDGENIVYLDKPLQKALNTRESEMALKILGAKIKNIIMRCDAVPGQEPAKAVASAPSSSPPSKRDSPAGAKGSVGGKRARDQVSDDSDDDVPLLLIPAKNASKAAAAVSPSSSSPLTENMATAATNPNSAAISINSASAPASPLKDEKASVGSVKGEEEVGAASSATRSDGGDNHMVCDEACGASAVPSPASSPSTSTRLGNNVDGLVPMGGRALSGVVSDEADSGHHGPTSPEVEPCASEDGNGPGESLDSELGISGAGELSSVVSAGAPEVAGDERDSGMVAKAIPPGDKDEAKEKEDEGKDKDEECKEEDEEDEDDDAAVLQQFLDGG